MPRERVKSRIDRIKTNLAIRSFPVTAIKPDPRNARKHSKEQIERLAAVIRELGFTNPILLDEQLTILCGHARREAALLVPMDDVPCILIEGLTSAEKKALAIADNKLSDLSSFDQERLALVLAEIEIECPEFDMELTGFATGEIDLVLDADGFGAAGAAAADVGDDIPPVEQAVVSRMGNMWIMNQHRLLCGDALDEQSYQTLLGNERADLVIEDQPFNVPINGHVTTRKGSRRAEFAMASGEMSEDEFIAFLTKSMGLAAKFSKPGSIHYQFMDHRHVWEMLSAVRAVGLEYKNLCVWNKAPGAGLGSLYRSQHELVFVLKNGSPPHTNNVKLGKYGRNRTNVWAYPGLAGFAKDREEKLEAHPTIKNLAMIADAIRDCSKRGDLVLDAFSGSGTTIMAAERTRRRAGVIEIEPAYVDVGVRRWQNQTGNAAILFGDGRTFDEIAAARAAESAPEPQGDR